MSRKLLLLVALPAVLALMFFGAGCGGGDDESSDDGAPAAAATTSESSPPAPPAASEESVGNCKEFQEAAANVGQQFSAATTGAGGDLKEASKAFDELASKAPDEIKADFQTINEAFATLAEALEGVDLSGNKTPDAATLAKLQKAMAAIDQAKVTAANARITAWVQKNCKA
jgi:hypothetical protein